MNEDILDYFVFSHLPPALQDISRPFSVLAHRMAELTTGEQREVGLQKLLEAKDCMVRAAIWNHKK